MHGLMFVYIYNLLQFVQKDEFVAVLNKRMMEVKSVFVQEKDIFKKLELVDWIQKLGLANHFQKEINGFLESLAVHVKTSTFNLSSEHLHLSALSFRLLRNHGYAVLPGNKAFSL